VETAVRRRTEPARRGPEAAAGVQEGDEEVARKLPRVDVVLMVSLVTAERGRSGGTTARPSGGGEPDCRRGVLVA
jgi:hypothetical protein